MMELSLEGLEKLMEKEVPTIEGCNVQCKVDGQ
jgi:hypothetical protein